MAKRDAAAREKWGNRLGGVVLALTDAPTSTRAWSNGSEGEAKLAAALSDIDCLIALHDRRVPGTRGNIDHIIVAPAGVFVVDAKRTRAWSGFEIEAAFFGPTFACTWDRVTAPGWPMG